MFVTVSMEVHYLKQTCVGDPKKPLGYMAKRFEACKHEHLIGSL